MLNFHCNISNLYVCTTTHRRCCSCMDGLMAASSKKVEEDGVGGAARYSSAGATSLRNTSSNGLLSLAEQVAVRAVVAQPALLS